MNRFRKSDSKSHGGSAHHHQQRPSPRLSPLNLKLLRRCRIVLVKDLDAVELLRQLPDDDGLGSEVRSVVAALPDRAQQAAALLDALEAAGDATFAAFVGLLRDQHRQLHSVLEETRRCLGEDDGADDDQTRERAAVAGRTVRRLLSRYDGRSSRSVDDAASSAGGGRAASTGSPELSDDPSSLSSEYISCFTVPTRGRRLQPEPWIEHATTAGDLPSADSTSAPPGSAPYETCVTSRDMIFRRVDVASLRHLAALLRLPADTVSAVYVVDSEYIPDLSATDGFPSTGGTLSDRGGTLVPAISTNEPTKLAKTRCVVHLIG